MIVRQKLQCKLEDAVDSAEGQKRMARVGSILVSGVARACASIQYHVTNWCRQGLLFLEKKFPYLFPSKNSWRSLNERKMRGQSVETFAVLAGMF